MNNDQLKPITPFLREDTFKFELSGLLFLVDVRHNFETGAQKVSIQLRSSGDGPSNELHIESPWHSFNPDQSRSHHEKSDSPSAFHCPQEIFAEFINRLRDLNPTMTLEAMQPLFQKALDHTFDSMIQHEGGNR